MKETAVGAPGSHPRTRCIDSADARHGVYRLTVRPRDRVCFARTKTNSPKPTALPQPETKEPDHAMKTLPASFFVLSFAVAVFASGHAPFFGQLSKPFPTQSAPAHDAARPSLGVTENTPAIHQVERWASTVLKNFAGGSALDSALQAQQAQAEATVALSQWHDSMHVLPFSL